MLFFVYIATYIDKNILNLYINFHFIYNIANLSHWRPGDIREAVEHHLCLGLARNSPVFEQCVHHLHLVNKTLIQLITNSTGSYLCKQWGKWHFFKKRKMLTCEACRVLEFYRVKKRNFNHKWHIIFFPAAVFPKV